MTYGEGSPSSTPLRGSALLVVIMVILIVALLIPSILRSFTLKNQTQLNYRNSDAMDAVVQAIVTKSVFELRDIFQRYGGGPFPQGPLPGTPDVRYTQLRPRIFAKGDPAFIVDVRQFDGNLFGPRRFLAPEEDPQVWIAAFGAGIGNNVMPLRVVTQICRLEIAGRAVPIFPFNIDPVKWNPLCPPNHLINVNYTGLIQRNNL